MSYQIIFSKEEKSDIQKLDNAVKKRLKKKLEEISLSVNVMSLAKRLTNFVDADYRIRIGDYRLTFDLYHPQLTLAQRKNCKIRARDREQPEALPG